MRRERQLKLAFNPRRGRPPAPEKTRASYIWHRSRPEIPKGKPVHVTLKGDKNILGTLRNKLVYKEIRASMRQARNHGIGIVEFSVQRDHIHLLIEPQNKQRLGEAMRAFTISLTKRLSHLAGKKIKAFISRYHLHILLTLAEIRRARAYIINNGKKHNSSTTTHDWYSSSLPLASRRLSNALLELVDELAHVIDPPRLWALRKQEIFA